MDCKSFPSNDLKETKVCCSIDALQENKGLKPSSPNS